MKIWENEKGRSSDTPVGDVFVVRGGQCYLRLHDDFNNAEPMWKIVSRSWIARHLFTQEDRAYLRESLGVSEEIEL